MGATVVMRGANESSDSEPRLVDTQLLALVADTTTTEKPTSSPAKDIYTPITQEGTPQTSAPTTTTRKAYSDEIGVMLKNMGIPFWFAVTFSMLVIVGVFFAVATIPYCIYKAVSKQKEKNMQVVELRQLDSRRHGSMSQARDLQQQ